MSIEEPTERATAPDPTEPVDPAASSSEDSAAEPARSAQRGLKLAVVALAALSFALAVVAAIASTSDNGDKREAEVRRAAGAFGTAILDYDFENVAGWKRNVTQLSTGVFKKQFAEYSESLATIFVNTKNVSEVRDVEVFLNDVDDDAATAIVVVDTTTSGLSGAGRSVTAYLRLDLVRTGNGWLVDGLTNLNLGAAPSSVAPTTTTP